MSNLGGINGSAAQQAVSTGANAEQALLNQTLFANLLPCQWREVGFPYTDFRVNGQQDVVQHKFADLDGADVEATGRAPMVFIAQIPFLNNIQAAPSELWQSGDLFPNQFNKFIAAVNDRTSAYLQHPVFGPVYCKVDKWDFALKAQQPRDGVWVNVTWIETFEPDGGVSPNLTGGGQITAASQAGIDLDALLPTLPASSFPQLPKATPSFSDFARSLQSVSDQVSLLEYQAAGKVDSVIASAQAVQFSISQATSNPFDSSNSVQAWPVRDANDRYIQALIGIRQTLLSSGAKIGLYYPKADTSLPLIAQTLPADIGDLMSLNPSLLSSIVVPALTQVRYYA
jgi:DNA circularisation protein N-terminus